MNVCLVNEMNFCFRGGSSRAFYTLYLGLPNSEPKEPEQDMIMTFTVFRGPRSVESSQQASQDMKNGKAIGSRSRSKATAQKRRLPLPRRLPNKMVRRSPTASTNLWIVD